MERYGRVWYESHEWPCRIDDDGVVLLDGDWLTGTPSPVRRVDSRRVEWRPPVVPRTVLCVGRNYRAHAQEFDNAVPAEPLFFLKQVGSLIGHNAAVMRPTDVGRVDFEGEMVLVIGEKIRNVTDPIQAQKAIWGLSIGNDITARELQKKDGQWTRAKGFDTFAPLGPWVVRESNPRGRRLTTSLNGVLKQDGSTDDLIFTCERLIIDASKFMTLYPGDVIFTGTPAGVGPVEPGDTVEITVQGIGTLSNSIKNRD